MYMHVVYMYRYMYVGLHIHDIVKILLVYIRHSLVSHPGNEAGEEHVYYVNNLAAIPFLYPPPPTTTSLSLSLSTFPYF